MEDVAIYTTGKLLCLQMDKLFPEKDKEKWFSKLTETKSVLACKSGELTQIINNNTFIDNLGLSEIITPLEITINFILYFSWF